MSPFQLRLNSAILKTLSSVNPAAEYTYRPTLKTTPGGLSILKITVSARRTKDSGSTGWPTPDTPCGGDRAADPMRRVRGTGTKVQVSLETAIRLIAFPSPSQDDSERGSDTMIGGNLMEMARKRSAVARGISMGTGCSTLSCQVELLPSGPMRSPSSAATESTAASLLNPLFSLWLMGYPVAWASCGAPETRSSRKSPRSLSKRSSRAKPKSTVEADF